MQDKGGNQVEVGLDLVKFQARPLGAEGKVRRDARGTPGACRQRSMHKSRSVSSCERVSKGVKKAGNVAWCKRLFSSANDLSQRDADQ